MRRRHNRVLHTLGIAEGLRVTFASGSNVTAVTVRPGTAIDSHGREIVLVEDETVELASQADNAPVWIAISYREAESRQTSETGVAGNTRLVESPLLEALPNVPDNVDKLVLAQVNRGVGSNPKQIAGIDESGRALAGAVEGDVVLTPRDPAVPQPQWVTLSWSGPNRADVLGTLDVRKSSTGVAGDLSVEGATSLGGALSVSGLAQFNGNIAIGTTDPKRRFHLEGSELHVGSNGGFSFSNRQSDFVEVPRAGERWVLYASEGLARLWSGGDKLVMNSNGLLVVDAEGRNDGTIDVRTEPARAAGIVFGTWMSGEGIASRRTKGDTTWGLDFYTGYQNRLAILNNGFVGIGTTIPSTNLDVNGWAKVAGLIQPSDARLKKNVSPLTDALDRLVQLNGITFEWKKTGVKAAGASYHEAPGGGDRQIGLAADEVEKQFPELVSHWEGADGKTYGGLDYGRMTAVIIEAIKELAARVDELASRVDALEPRKRPKR
jgi:Chaperone of endosialidase